MSRFIRFAKPRQRPLSATNFERIVNYLAPTTTVRSILRVGVDRALQQQLTLTDAQRRIMASMKNHRRLHVEGAAGTGKTVLVTERAHQLAAEGLRVLFLCYNQPLGQRLAANVVDIPTITAGSFHQFAMQTIRRSGLRLPAQPTDAAAQREHWDETVPLALIEAADAIDLYFDAVIIDEGQDFAPSWIDVAEGLLEDPDRGHLIVFSDPKQNIYRDDTDRKPEVSLPIDATVLDVNCRNTPEIAERAGNALGIAYPTLAGPSGLRPHAISLRSKDDLIDRLGTEVQRLVREEQINPTDLVILSSSRALVDEIQGMRLANLAVGDLDGSGLRAETVHRFKGLESPAVIVVEPADSTISPNLAYIAFSRANAVLSLIASSAVLRRIGWDN